MHVSIVVLICRHTIVYDSPAGRLPVMEVEKNRTRIIDDCNDRFDNNTVRGDLHEKIGPNVDVLRAVSSTP